MTDRRLALYSRVEPALSLIPFLVLGVALAACTRSSIPQSLALATATMASPPTVTPETPIPPTPPETPSVGAYAVVWASPEEGLPVLQPAGIAGSEIGRLEADQRGVRLTGTSTVLGSSIWWQLQDPMAGGWVNSWNLTEDMPPDVFCADGRVDALLQTFRQVIQARDGQGLAEMVSRRRGLVVRHDWWNPEVELPEVAVATLFSETTAYDWGMGDASGLAITGSFVDVILPMLDDVLGGDPEVACNRLGWGTTGGTVIWPGELGNLNYYSFYRPDRGPGDGFNWATLAVGVEYVEGQPLVAILVLYRGEIQPHLGRWPTGLRLA
jgi:hypothetical protein